MEKLVFRFRRKPKATREAFFNHYISVHAPLGMREKTGLDGYTVNLVEDDADFDALTEIWTASAADFTGGSKAPTEGERLVIADHMSFMGPQDSYLVEERIVVDGPQPPVAPGFRAPGVKLAMLYKVGEQPDAPDPAATRVVDNVVRTIIYDHDKKEGRPPDRAGDLALIRTLWSETVDAFDPPPQGALLLYQYRNRDLKARS